MSPVAALQPETRAVPVVYPDSDGEPMADNTEQFDFIQTVCGNLRAIRTDFVSGDQLWYPVEGHPEICVAPDVYVAAGRPKGPRGSYKQWEEGGTPLTVVFEWWSPNSTFPKELAKFRFYDRHGVSEFYSWDQVRRRFAAFVRDGKDLVPVNVEDGWTSPILGIRFAVADETLRMFRPDGTLFRSYEELDIERAAAAARADAATAERDAATAERDAATARAEALAEKLRAAGLDPD